MAKRTTYVIMAAWDVSVVKATLTTYQGRQIDGFTSEPGFNERTEMRLFKDVKSAAQYAAFQQSYDRLATFSTKQAALNALKGFKCKEFSMRYDDDEDVLNKRHFRMFWVEKMLGVDEDGFADDSETVKFADFEKLLGKLFV